MFKYQGMVSATLVLGEWMSLDLVRNYCTPSPLRYALTIKKMVGSGITM
jgi:hypothetical protein